MGLALAPIEGTPYIGGNQPGDLSVDSAGLQRVIKHNLLAQWGPTVNDDSTAGYAVGSRWIDTVTGNVYACVSADAGAAAWKQTSALTTPGGTSGAIQYNDGAGGFAGSSNATLSASGAAAFGDTISVTGNIYAFKAGGTGLQIGDYPPTFSNTGGFYWKPATLTFDVVHGQTTVSQFSKLGYYGLVQKLGLKVESGYDQAPSLNVEGSSGQTQNLVEINTYGNTGGDAFKIAANKGATFGGGITATGGGFNLARTAGNYLYCFGTGPNSMQFGQNAAASGNTSSTMGYNSQASGVYSSSYGGLANASQTYACAFGAASAAAYVSSVALGTGATTGAANQLFAGSATAPIADVRFHTGGGSLAIGNENGSGIVLNTSQQVGIGTTFPVTKFHVSGDGLAPNAALYTTDIVTISAENTAPGFNIIAASSNAGHRGVFKATRAKGTLASPLAVADGNYVFSLLGAPYDGSTAPGTAEIAFIMDGAVSVGNLPTAITFLTATATTRQERMRIAPEGKVGIGTTDPDMKLTVEEAAATSCGIGIYGATNQAAYFSFKSGGSYQTSFGLAGTAGHYFTDAVAGDFNIRAATGQTLRLGVQDASPTASALQIDSSKNATFDGTISAKAGAFNTAKEASKSVYCFGTGANSLTYGQSAQASGPFSTSCGYAAQASGTGAVAVGAMAAATNTYSAAIGFSTDATYANSLAIGTGAATTAASQAVFGSATAPITDVRFHTGGGSLAIGNENGSGLTLDGSQNATFSANLNSADLGVAGNLTVNSSAGTPLQVMQSAATKWAVTSTAAFSSLQNGGAHLNRASALPTIIPYSFVGDENTGLYSAGADALGLATGGTAALTIDASQNASFAADITVPMGKRIWGGAHDHDYLYFGVNDYPGAILQAHRRLDIATQSATNTSSNIIFHLGTGGASTGRFLWLSHYTPNYLMILDAYGNLSLPMSGGSLSVTGGVTCGGDLQHSKQVYQAAEVDNMPAGTAQSVDWRDGNLQTLDLSSATGDVTVTFTDPSGSAELCLIVTQGATPRDITWPASVKWDAEPTWNDAGEAAKSRCIRLRRSGSTYYAWSTGTYS